MSELLLLSNFFLNLVILVVVVSVASQLVDIEADLYYYFERDGDDDKFQHFDGCIVFNVSGVVGLVKELVKLPPCCTWCEHFRYKKGAEKLYRCKQSCEMSNDIFELFENCYRLDYKYGVIE